MHEFIEKELARIAGEVKNRSGVDIAFLLAHSLGRAMRRSERIVTDSSRWEVALHNLAHTKQQRMPSAVASDLVELSRACDHIGDWLAASVAADLKWLKNVDANGVPRKFAKFTTIETVDAEARRGMERLLKANVAKTCGDGGEARVADLGNGYSIVSLKTAEALDRESGLMQHCVGLGGYDEGVKSGEIEILSLRDNRGRPHVTMEVDASAKTVIQIKGKQNRFPLSRYFDMLLPWLQEQEMTVRPHDLAGGYFSTGDGTIRHFTQIGEGDEIDGNLVLRFDGDDELEVLLPKGLRVQGNLEIHAVGHVSGISVRLEEGVYTKGNAIFVGCRCRGLENLSAEGIEVTRGRIDTVPDGARISSDMVLSMTETGSILDRAVFERSLKITTEQPISIGKFADVRGELSIHGAPCVDVETGVNLVGSLEITEGADDDSIVRIREDVTVGGSLTIIRNNCDFNVGLTVGGTLALVHCTLENLPSRLDVGGLHLKYPGNVKAIPDDAAIRGDVSIAHAMIHSLGNRAKWSGDLALQGVSLARLPADLDVAGDLFIEKLPLHAFPDEMKIGGSLKARKCACGTLPANAHIGKDIDFSFAKQVDIPDGFQVNGSLDLEGAEIIRMPTGVVVGELLRLGRLEIDRITDHFEAACYDITGARIRDMSDLKQVEGDLWLDADHIGLLSDEMEIGGNLVIKGDASPGLTLPSSLVVGDCISIFGEQNRGVVPASLQPGGGVRVYAR